MAPADSTTRSRRLLLCVSGGFQAYATPGIVLALLRHVADDVQVVLSRSAARLVQPYAVEVVSRHPAYVELEDTGPDVFVPHIELSRQCDLVLVYPATVNVMSKVAHGIADELVPALILAAECPVIFVPMTNPSMEHHPAVARNVSTLRADGYVVLPAIPGVEVATREGLDELVGPFPLPTLQLQISAVLSSDQRGRARRVEGGT